MAIRAISLAAAALSTGDDSLANAALNLARRVKPIALRRRAMTLAALSKGGGYANVLRSPITGLIMSSPITGLPMTRPVSA